MAKAGKERSGSPCPPGSRDRHPVKLDPLTIDVRHHLWQVSGGNGPCYEINVMSPGWSKDRFHPVAAVATIWE